MSTESTSQGNNDNNQKITTLVEAKLKEFQHFNFLKDLLFLLVAPQEKDFLQELILDKSLILLNKKKKLDRILKIKQKLQNSDLPPLSVRFKAELTSPDPEVVASKKFAEIRKEFNETIANWNMQCKNLFVKTKELEVEMASKEIQDSFIQHFHRIIEVMTTHQIDIMINTSNMNKIETKVGTNYSQLLPGD